MSYIGLLNETVYTGIINATSIRFIGEVDFIEATPIIGLTDNITLEIINNPLTGRTLNIMQIKDNGVTNIKIVSMDSNKLTGNIEIISGIIYLDLPININGNILPYSDSSYSIGSLLYKWNNMYANNGYFVSKIDTPYIDNDTSITIRINSINIAKFNTLNGLDMLGNNINNVPIITNTTGVAIQFNGSTKILTTNTGITITGITDTSIINNATGITLQFNGSTKIAVTNIGVTITGVTDTSTINNVSGVAIQFNGSTKISTTNTGVTINGNLSIVGSQTTTYDSSTNTLNVSSGGLNINLVAGNILALNSSTVRCQQSLNCASDNLYDIGLVSSNRFRTAYLATSCVTPTITGPTTLTLSATTQIFLNYGGAVTDGVYIGGNTIKNRKIVLFNVGNDDHQYYGFGINGGTLRYQAASSADGHRFYCALNSSSSQELLSIYNAGITAQRLLNMNSNAINNVTTLSSATIVNTGTIKTAGFVSGHRTITTNTSLTETDSIISVNTSSSSITITLPLISGLTYSAGRQWTIKDISGLASRNNIIINTTSPNLLDGSNTLRVNASYSSVSIYCDGSNYFIF